VEDTDSFSVVSLSNFQKRKEVDKFTLELLDLAKVSKIEKDELELI